MSLVNGPRLIVAVAAAAAVAVPMMLLGGEAVRVPTLPQAQLTEIGSPEPGGLSYALAAPPFDSDRSAGNAPQGDLPPPPAQAPPPPPPPVLVGIVSGGGRPGVALARGTDGKTETLAAGASLGAWRLVSIGRDAAVFELGGVRHTARLDFSNKSAPEHPPAPSELPMPIEHDRRQEAALGQQPDGNSL